MQIVLFNTFFVVSGSVISLSFVEDYMELYRLKEPLFVLNSDSLDEFYLQLQNTSFEAIGFICYDQSNIQGDHGGQRVGFVDCDMVVSSLSAYSAWAAANGDDTFEFSAPFLAL